MILRNHCEQHTMNAVSLIHTKSLELPRLDPILPLTRQRSVQRIAFGSYFFYLAGISFLIYGTFAISLPLFIVGGLMILAGLYGTCYPYLSRSA